ncbi:MAG TPA: hypothetical protein VJB59_12755 [Bdellovibrionota bacterium]|nr:hypothetical protein [Bdellovibrionota bacterium]
MKNFVLLISKTPEDRTFVERAAQIAGIPVRVVESVESAGKVFLAGEIPQAVFLDLPEERNYREFDRLVNAQSRQFQETLLSDRLHFLISRNIDECPYLVAGPYAGNILKRSGALEHEGVHYGRILQCTLSQKGPELLGPEFKNRGGVTQEFVLGRTTEKQSAIEKVRDLFLEHGFLGRVAEVIATAADELLMNAMFDAPVDDAGRQIYSKVDRSTDFELLGRHAVKMVVGFDGAYGAVSVTDSFGSLERAKLLKHVLKLYKDDTYHLGTEVAGAGIGLASVFQLGGSLFFFSEQGKKTEVIAFFKRAESFREYRGHFRFLTMQFR